MVDRMKSSPTEGAAAWFVAQIKPGLEKAAERDLEHQGFLTCMPMFERKAFATPRGRKPVIVRRLLFPGYAFVAFDAVRSRWQAILSTIGVTGLVSYRVPDERGNSRKLPLRMPRSAMEQILGLMDEDGLVHCDDEQMPDLTGRPLRVTTGPFEGFEGLCKRSDAERVSVLLAFFGRDMVVEFLRTHTMLMDSGRSSPPLGRLRSLTNSIEG